MAKRIRKDRAAYAIGIFTSKYPGLENVAQLEVIVEDDRAKVGFHMYNDANEIDKAEFASLFAARKWIEMNDIDKPESESEEDKSPEEVAQELQENDHTDEDGNFNESEHKAEGDGTQTEGDGTQTEGEPASAQVVKKRGRPRMTVKERTAKIAADLNEPKKEKKTKKAKVAKTAKENGTGVWAEKQKEAAERKAKILAEGKPAFRPGSQRARMLELLEEGTTIANLETVLGQTRKSKGGWQSSFHDMGLILSRKIESSKTEDGDRVFKLI